MKAPRGKHPSRLVLTCALASVGTAARAIGRRHTEIDRIPAQWPAVAGAAGARAG